MKYYLLLLALIATPVVADGGASATISISVRIADQPSSIQVAAETDVCARLLQENPAVYLESGCSMIVSNHRVSQPESDLLRVEPI